MEPNTNSTKRKVVPANEILAKIERGEDVEYDDRIIEGDLDISRLKLPTEKLDRTEDEKRFGLSKERKVIGSKITISNSQIQGNVNISNARFQEPISFEGTGFSGYNNFKGTEFGRKADFGGAKFTRDAYTSGDVDFWGGKFCGNADFIGVEFSGDVYFIKTEFDSYVDFFGAKFNDAHFEEAEFAKDAVLRLDDLKFQKLYITWETIRDNLDYYGPAYLALVKNFKVLEQFSDAGDCYYQYRKESQAQKKWYSNNRIDWSKLFDWIGYRTCGYGVKVWRPIVCAFGSVLGFTLLYKLLPQSYGGIAESGPSTVTMEAVNNSTLLLTFSSGDGAVSPSFWECLYFSFTALTGGTPDGLRPVGLCKYAVMVEGVLGYLFLALFVVVLARKIIR